MRFLKVTMSDGSHWVFTEEEAKKMLTDKRQLYPVKNKDGSWNGRVLNKAHIVGTDFDYETERRWAERQKMKRLKLENKIPEKQRKKNLKILKRMKEKLIRKKIINK